MNQDPSSTSQSRSSPLQRCNRTELYQLCRRAGINVHPGTPREWLIGFLLGDYEAPKMSEEEHPVDRWRVALIRFIEDYWARLQPQLKCPAKDLKHPNAEQRNTRPCFGCSDMQVMNCLADNANNIERIRLYILRRKS
jgi:hypothetical protein